MPRTVRRASHAGDWYESDGKSLEQSIASWISVASSDPGVHARAIISPHAGYRYCGHVMAYAYKQINPHNVKRMFILGPSHHFFTRKCMLSQMEQYATPLGPLHIDTALVRELYESGMFDYMDVGVDEAEHSLELQLSFIAYIMRGCKFLLVPIMVGSLSPDSEAEYGRLLGPYLSDPQNAFIISSDFCHWGARFRYTFHDERYGSIYQSITWLDKTGMDIIEQGDPLAFTAYLRKYENTICGRHPISVFLQMLVASGRKHQIKFQKYDQSSKCVAPRDSSVSYAAATVVAVE